VPTAAAFVLAPLALLSSFEVGLLPWPARQVVVGKKSVELAAAEWSITFKADRWTMVTQEGKAEGTVKLDLTAKPARMDLVSKKATVYCGYTLSKDTLRLCTWSKAADRQATLDPLKQDPPGLLLVMERWKAGPVLDARR
jgi:uncharacterized protein (TIGR03067 family)